MNIMKKTKKIVSVKKTVAKKPIAKKSIISKKTATKKTAPMKKTGKKPEPVVASGAVAADSNVVVVHSSEETIDSIVESVPVATAKTRKTKR